MTVFNFSPGPCTLPREVLSEAQEEFVDYQGSGMSLIEVSHRTDAYEAVHYRALELARQVAEAPDDFEVLFIQGGATLQFAMVPINLLKEGTGGGYSVTGTWARRALEDAVPHGDAYTAWDGAEHSYTRAPRSDEIVLRPSTGYLHITANETIGGIRYATWPDVEPRLVADVSSEFMTRSIPWDRCDVVYGGVQKNLGPAGMAVVFIRRSVLRKTRQDLAAYLRYDRHADHDSLLNTPPTFTVYMTGKVLEWMKSQGGLDAMEDAASRKASLLYEAIDGSDGFYRAPVDPASRSLMNVVFRLPSATLDDEFSSQARDAGLVGLKGHRSVGGCRASLYAAMPFEGVQALVDFMADFRAARR